MEPYLQIEQYAKDLDIDTQVDVTNIMEKQMSAPNVRHKWLYKLVQSKQGLLRLLDEKEALMQHKMQGNPLPVSAPALKRKAEGDLDIRTLNNKIHQQELLVEYLDGAVKQINQIGFDFKNLVELMKMENL
jgi:Tfp pilus assembly protein PilN